MPELAPAPAQQPPQPPFGASPVSQASPNKGYEAAALQKLGLVGKQLQEILTLAGYNSDIGKEVLKMLQTVSKLVPAGGTNPAAERHGIEQLAMKNTQQNQMMQQLKQQMAGAGGGQAAPGGAQPGGAPPTMARAA